MEFLFIFCAGFTIGITGAIIPGPLTFFAVTETLKTDGFAGAKAISGHIAFEALLIGLLFLGFKGFFASERFLNTVSLVGGIALAAMGMILLINSPRMKLSSGGSGQGFSKGLFLGGVFFSAVSPGFIIWWATIGLSTMVKALLSGMAGVGVLLLGHWLADLSWYSILSYSVHKGRSQMGDKGYRNLARFFSIMLIALGAYFLIKR